MKHKEYSGMDKKVESYQQPESVYSQHDANATLKYVERQDKTVSKEAGKLKGQAHKGRYQ